MIAVKLAERQPHQFFCSSDRLGIRFRHFPIQSPRDFARISAAVAELPYKGSRRVQTVRSISIHIVDEHLAVELFDN